MLGGWVTRSSRTQFPRSQRQQGGKMWVSRPSFPPEVMGEYVMQNVSLSVGSCKSRRHAAPSANKYGSNLFERKIPHHSDYLRPIAAAEDCFSYNLGLKSRPADVPPTSPCPERGNRKVPRPAGALFLLS